MATVTVSFLYLFPYIACSREAVKQRSRRNVPPPHRMMMMMKMISDDEQRKEEKRTRTRTPQ